MVKFWKSFVVYLKERKAKIFSLLYARKGKIMALSNLENRVKQDSAYPRTAEDAIRRDKDIDKVTIKASQIELEGYTTVNGGFKIDNTGNMECNNATITGGKINLTSNETSPALVLTSSINDRMSTEVTGTHIGIYEKDLIDPSISTPKFSLSYFENQGYTAMAMQGQQSYLSLGTYTLNGNLVVPVSISELNGGLIELTSLDGTNTIKLNGSNGNIKCVSLTQTSLEEAKKNFEKFENALDLIKGIDIYKYNLKAEDNGDKKHIGFVIGDGYKYKREITDKQNKGVDLYSFVSLCCKAIQEQQEEIEELRKLVNK